MGFTGRSAPLMVGVLLTGALVAAPVAADDADGEPSAGVEWGACPDDVEAGPQPLECGTVPVPVDYADPDGARIDLTVSRIASQDPGARRGVLLLNPGGPGASGLSMPADLASLGLPASVMNSYDLIGMDTRGVGHSAPVSCGFDVESPYRGNVPPYAVDEAAFEEQVAVSESVAAQCADHDVDGLMPHISTANMARDLDRVRAALGEDQASFFGLSYGSALGAAYASMFPESSDRVILDSNIGDTFLDHEAQRRFALGFEETFPDYADWLARRDGSYGLGGTAEEVEATYVAMAARLDAEPVAGIDGRTFRLLSFVGVYGEVNYARTAQLWQSLHSDDDAAVQRYLDEHGPVGGQEPETPLLPSDNDWSAYLAVVCNDVDWPEDVDTYRDAVAEDRELYPKFGAAAANTMPCAFWENEPAEAPVRITGDGPSNVLIMQNLRDPATPHLGGRLLDEKFGQRSRLVSVDDTGHGVYVFGDNPCAWNVATSYLVDGEFPERDLSCEASSGLDLDGGAERLRTQTLDRLENAA